MAEISRWGYNPDKNRDWTGLGRDDKISLILTFYQDRSAVGIPVPIHFAHTCLEVKLN